MVFSGVGCYGGREHSARLASVKEGTAGENSAMGQADDSRSAGIWHPLFVVVEGMILSEFAATAEPGAEYVIVLGAQWKENGPSDVLRRRLDKALVYLRENPDAKVIVSGGQGENEPLSEADGMREYLLGAGIPEERILTETESFNTKQNLEYSSRFLNPKEDRVVLVTNNFHMFRALRIARKQGYQRAEGLAASSVYGFLPNNMLREFLSLVKNLAVGNL